ncbi:DNA polymerase ligase N-terminal domain-containing protein [uncultured Salinisphaera sp.]|uniref:DNA polymerase ligase N-terminal domain-containing protein n=1 Tax=uncultured Salinisphaera sp. TaxID=359372 RepID=UPI0032B28BA5
MTTQDKLARYRDRRDPERSPEPSGRAGVGKGGDRPIFVIQKHDASTLHYDFRLEIDGVLKSWAVPKGPSTDPREKRLAVETEDHPLDYADFEGVIPGDQYGGGTVLVWDTGPFENAKRDDDGHIEKSLADCFADGHLTVVLHGEKISGGYSLTHFRSENGKRQWLLVKMDDDAADARRNPVNTEPDSVLSDRGLADIAAQGPDND